VGNRESKQIQRSGTDVDGNPSPRYTRRYTKNQITKNNKRWRAAEKLKGNEVDKDTCHPNHTPEMLARARPVPIPEGAEDANPLRDNVPR